VDETTPPILRTVFPPSPIAVSEVESGLLPIEAGSPTVEQGGLEDTPQAASIPHTLGGDDNRVAIGQARVGKRILRVLMGCLFKISDRPGQVLIRSLVPVVTAFQIIFIPLRHHRQCLCALRKQGRGRKLLADLSPESKRQCVSPYSFAVVYVGLGRQEDAINWLEKAFVD
jgi:hypothetical protein